MKTIYTLECPGEETMYFETKKAAKGGLRMLSRKVRGWWKMKRVTSFTMKLVRIAGS